jgi:hypothetical protein
MPGLGTGVVAMPLSLRQLLWLMGSKGLMASFVTRLFSSNLSIINSNYYIVRSPPKVLADVHLIV